MVTRALPVWYRLLGKVSRVLCRVVRSPRLGPWEACLEPTVWLHAASVGEAKGIVALLRFLPPELSLTLTATTASGVERLARTGHRAFLLPLDEPTSIEEFLASRQVCAAVFFEAEAWPCALEVLRERAIPTAFAAFRCGRASLSRWRRFSRLFPGWTGAVEAVWTDSVTYVGAVERLGFAHVRPGSGLKWAGHPCLPKTARQPPLAAAVSFHLRDLATVLDLARTRPKEGWLWFPRRPHRKRLHLFLARLAGLRVVDGMPQRGEVRISHTFGETAHWLAQAKFCWVSPGHDLEEPNRLGVPEIWTGRPARAALPVGSHSDGVARDIARWIVESASAKSAYYNGGVIQRRIGTHL